MEILGAPFPSLLVPICLKSDTDSLNGRGSNAVYDLGKRKVVYTTASVAYGWAGLVMQFRQLFRVLSHSVTDRRMDQPSNEPSNGPTE